VSGSVDVGGATVAYDDFLRSAVVSAVPAVRVETARTTLVARGAVSRFESGNSALQATLAGSAFSPQVWKLRGELFGTFGVARYTDTLSAVNLFMLGRLHAASTEGGAWLGAGGGLVSQRSLLPLYLWQVDLGGWTRLRDIVYTATVTPTRVGSLQFTDVVGGARWQNGRGELGGSAGARLGRDVADLPGAERWVEAQATFWMTPRLALVGGLGVFPADVVQGLPGGRYASAALRIGGRRLLTSDPTLRAELTLPYELERLRRTARPGDFQVQSTQDGTRLVRLTLRGARTVELMADFTDWMPVPFEERADGVWELALFISPGVHRVNVRVDGGAWRVPPGLTAARDEFGGEVGLMVVQ
jgi:hypothetical protein